MDYVAEFILVMPDLVKFLSSSKRSCAQIIFQAGLAGHGISIRILIKLG